jgi:BolA family transcriptional regulator, general stress-responsive regulator
MIVQSEIETILADQFQPTVLEVVNESHMHSVPPNSETHFKVVIVTDLFNDTRKVARHQQVYGALSAQLEGPVHALALHTYTPAEWADREQAPDSPNCMGGSKAEAL